MSFSLEKDFIKSRILDRKNVFVARASDSAIALTLDDDMCIFTNEYTMRKIFCGVNGGVLLTSFSACVYEYTPSEKRVRDIVINYTWHEEDMGEFTDAKPIDKKGHKLLLLELIK